MLSFRALRTISKASYIALVLAGGTAIGLSCITLISQAVRTSPHRTWEKNWNVVIIGAMYAVVICFSFAICLKRRIAVRRQMQHVLKAHKLLRKADVPKAVHEYIVREYMRTCLITYESQPKHAQHEGWGRPGTPYSGIYFRRALLDTIPLIDALAHVVIPSHPPLKPHARMLHHFRYLIPLLPSEEGDLSLLHYYDSAIQLARNSSREPTEAEFVIGIRTASAILKILDECREEMTVASLPTELNGDAFRYI